MESANFVNIDFEYGLFDPKYSDHFNQYSKMNKEFEFVYFYIEKNNEPLLKQREYPSEYLNKLKSVGISLPKMVSNHKFKINWWGNNKDHELEKILNSKITSTKLGIENNLCPSSINIVQNEMEIKNWISKFPQYQNWIARVPFEVAGRGSFQFINESQIPSEVNFPLIIGPYFNRILDFGFSYNVQTKESSWSINLNNSIGQFMGGLLIKNESKFFQFMEKELNIKWSDLIQLRDKIVDLYISMGAYNIIQIDSFIYKEAGSFKIYPLVEINHRKTMGLYLNSVRDLLLNDDFGFVLNVSNKKNKKDWMRLVDNYPYNIKTKKGIFVLSPPDNHFLSLFFSMPFSNMSIQEIFSLLYKPNPSSKEFLFNLSEFFTIRPL